MKKFVPQQINWSSLHDKRCPKCYFELKVRGLLDPMFYCSNLNCDFKISDAKYKDILNKMLHKPTRMMPKNNAEDLNNLGIEGEKLNDWGSEQNDENYETETD